VLREALSNVVRHAQAGAVHVQVIAAAERITVVVSDDGVGISGPGLGNGLLNLRSRVEDHGGEFTVAGASPRGTVATWTIPFVD
jgi:two-component system, NarL family, sensor histidine kinase DevS